MRYDAEIRNIEEIANTNADLPVKPAHSAPVARLIVRMCETKHVPVPLVVERFQDRVIGPKGGYHGKIARDFYGKHYHKLSADQQVKVGTLHSALGSSDGHPYLKKGLTFIQARHLLIETYREEFKARNLPEEIRGALGDFRRGLEHDIDDAAKAGGFFSEYARANQALRIRAAGPHRANQSIPIRSGAPLPVTRS